ncbi:hypothetical protein GQ54DRAFT_195518 [Martensiomyces pterosporus]|nr:hypothetical protein GQ54DRAFT_195518 [Martensiomyces pterosporus]
MARSVHSRDPSIYASGENGKLIVAVCYNHQLIAHYFSKSYTLPHIRFSIATTASLWPLSLLYRLASHIGASTNITRAEPRGPLRRSLPDISPSWQGADVLHGIGFGTQWTVASNADNGTWNAKTEMRTDQECGVCKRHLVSTESARPPP